MMVFLIKRNEKFSLFCLGLIGQIPARMPAKNGAYLQRHLVARTKMNANENPTIVHSGVCQHKPCK
jgi:hypothetical protein